MLFVFVAQADAAADCAAASCAAFSCAAATCGRGVAAAALW